jgi:hypothetical protein
MRRTLFSAAGSLGVFVLGLATPVTAQLPTGKVRSADVCCGIITIQPAPHDPTNGVVTIRAIRTGRTFQFKAGGGQLRSLQVGAAVVMDARSARVLSIAGVKRTYAVFEPDPAEPCCEIVTIRPDAHEPTNGIVTIRNDRTGATLRFTASREALGSLRVGTRVALDATGSYAMVQSAATSGARKATYSFPVKAAGAS